VEFVGRRIRGPNAIPANEVTCLYTWTTVEDFVLDRSGPFVVASPCTGHSAKFAPLLPGKRPDHAASAVTGVAGPLSGEAAGQVEGLRAAGLAFGVDVHVVEELAEFGVPLQRGGGRQEVARVH
jgi:hypothetical protein